MFPYIIYYFLSFSLLIFNKKWIPILFSILWFVFVGFRDAIGTDYFTALLGFERSYIDLTNIQDSFTGYNLVDMELVYKIISTFFYYLGIDAVGFYVVIAFFESVLIYYLLKKIKHKKILLVYFITMFTLNYPMNITRNGFSVLILIFGLNYYSSERIKRVVSIIFSALSHYASIPIILLSSIQIKKLSSIILVTIIISVIIYLFSDMIIVRWPTDDIGPYKFQGYGIKLIISTVLVLVINYFVVDHRLIKQENIILVLLMLVTYIYNPLARYNLYYSYVVLFGNLFQIDNRKISIDKIFLLLTFPLLTFFSEWLEISRFQPVSGLGNWIPYKNFIFNLF
jgi:hypothetical protein